jgi:anti-anti-sigma factor
MAPLLQSATTPTDGHAIATVRGDIDADTAAQLWQYLGYLIGQGHHHIVLDLRGMLLIDSVGVDVITRASAWTRRKGGELVCCGRPARPWSNSWSWPAAPRPTGVIPQPPATNPAAAWQPRPGGPRTRRLAPRRVQNLRLVAWPAGSGGTGRYCDVPCSQRGGRPRCCPDSPT